MWGGVATSCYRCMKSRPWLCEKWGVIVRKEGYDCVKRRTWLCEKRGVIVRKDGENCAKPLRKLSRIDRYEHVERSIRMFISTVMNMWNGRYEMTFSWVSPDFFRGLHLIFSWFLPVYLNAFTGNIAWFCALWSFIILLCINDKRGVLCAFP